MASTLPWTILTSFILGTEAILTTLETTVQLTKTLTEGPSAEPTHYTLPAVPLTTSQNSVPATQISSTLEPTSSSTAPTANVSTSSRPASETHSTTLPGYGIATIAVGSAVLLIGVAVVIRMIGRGKIKFPWRRRHQILVHLVKPIEVPVSSPSAFSGSSPTCTGLCSQDRISDRSYRAMDDKNPPLGYSHESPQTGFGPTFQQPRPAPEPSRFNASWRTDEKAPERYPYPPPPRARTRAPTPNISIINQYMADSPRTASLSRLDQINETEPHPINRRKGPATRKEITSGARSEFSDHHILDLEETINQAGRHRSRDSGRSKSAMAHPSSPSSDKVKTKPNPPSDRYPWTYDNPFSPVIMSPASTYTSSIQILPRTVYSQTDTVKSHELTGKPQVQEFDPRSPLGQSVGWRTPCQDSFPAREEGWDQRHEDQDIVMEKSMTPEPLIVRKPDSSHRPPMNPRSPSPPPPPPHAHNSDEINLPIQRFDDHHGHKHERDYSHDGNGDGNGHSTSLDKQIPNRFDSGRGGNTGTSKGMESASRNHPK